MANQYTIAVLSGDGIGSEVTAQAIKVLEALELRFEFIYCAVGSQAFNLTGNPIPEETKIVCDKADAVLLGAIGYSYAPYGIPMEVLHHLKIERDAFAHVCPLKLYPGVFSTDDPRSGRNIDMVFIRNNSDGFALEHEGYLWGDKAVDVRTITREGARRIVEFACEYAIREGRTKITCVDSHNYLYGDKLYRSVFDDVVKGHPKLEPDYVSVNVASMMLASNPSFFDVILTHDIYGDILEWQVIGEIGGVGMATAANLGSDFSFFQPVGGAAWKIAGKNIANPIGSILSTKLMLEWLGEREAASKIEEAVRTMLAAGKNRARNFGRDLTTFEVGDEIATIVES